MVDELFYDVDLDADGDVVGITAMGPQIQRAYDLADHFRARGVRVVLGGTWVTLTAEESLRHADAVVAGEAESVWPQVLDDLAAGRSRGIYRAAGWHSLRSLPRVDYTALPLLKYDAFQSSWLYRMYFHWPVVFSRGCPHPCEYCAVQTYYQRSFRTRPVDEVLDDLRDDQGPRRQPHPLPRRQPDRPPGGGQGALPRHDPARASSGRASARSTSRATPSCSTSPRAAAA